MRIRYFKHIVYIVLITLLVGCGGGGTTTGGNGTSGGGSGVSAVTVSATNPGDYVWATLTNGTATYIDRNFTYSQIPHDYEGFEVLETANADKMSATNPFISFEIDMPAIVYVAHFADSSSRPSWLSSWTVTGNVIVTTDRTLHVYSKDFSAGTVSLGGNEGDSGSSNYVVFINAGNTSSGSGSGSGNSAGSVILTLSWNANKDSIDGYKIYYGSSETTASKLLTNIPINSNGFNKDSPSYSYDAAIDLGAKTGQQICFRLKAYSNSTGESDYTQAVCSIV